MVRPDYVQLGRTFLPGDERQDREEAARTSYLRFDIDGTSWDDILRSRVTVVLAEAGSGKTWEMEAQAARSDEPSRPAFLVPLQALADGPLRAALLPPAATRLERWLDGRDEALFLLDSVDESRIRDVGGFEAALRSFAHGLGGAMARARLVITSRVSEWRHTHDRALVCAALGLPEAAGEGRSGPGVPPFRVVLLAPLSDGQVRRLAAATLGEDAGRFAAALDDAHAWDFARRPMDVGPLARFWAERRRLGTLPEILEDDIGRKLRPRDTRGEPATMPPERLRHGAERLAAASLLCGRLSFVVPDDSLRGPVLADALRPQDVLPDWPPGEVRALLGLPLFDPAAFGRVRLHHRLVAEYLAAQWLRRQVEQGCPHGRVRDLLVPMVRGRRVVVPSLAGVTAWLCGTAGDAPWLVRLRDAVVDVAPEVLVSRGDPRLLPLAVKRHVLRACMGRDAPWHAFHLDAGQLARMADPGLADDLATALSSPGVGAGGRRLALRTLWHARLGQARDALRLALDLALDPAGDEDTRLLAMRAVHAAGSDGQRRKLAHDLPSAGCSTAMTVDTIRLLYPGAMDVADLCRHVLRFPSQRRFAEGLPDAVAEAVEETPEDAIPDLVGRLVELVGPGHPGHAVPPPSAPFAWLAQPLALATARLLRKATLSPDETEVAVDALDRVGPLARAWPPGRHREPGLQALSERHAGVRAELLRRRLDTRTGEYLFGVYDAVRWCGADVGIIAEWVSGERDLARKVRLVRFAAAAWNRTGGDAGDRQALLRAARSSPAVDGVGRVLPGSVAVRRMRLASQLRYEWAWGIQGRVARLRWQLTRWQLWVRMLRGWGALSAGRPTGDLAAIAHAWLEGGRERPGSRGLHPDFTDVGGLVRRAARKGWKARWRYARVALPGAGGGIEDDLPIGLAGIQAAIDDGLDLSGLDHEEACTATRLAVRRLCGVPPWFDGLARHHPPAVQQVVHECLRLDWTLDGPAAGHVQFGSSLPFLGAGARDSAEPLLAELLGRGDPHPDVLRSALVLLLPTRPGRQAVAALAPSRVAAAGPGSPAYGHWLNAWLHADVAALDHLEGLSATDPAAADAVVTECAATLDSMHDRLDGPEPAFETAGGLARLVCVLHRHVRPDEDVRHGRGHHTPTRRDDIQQVRDNLLVRLAHRPEPEVYATLQGLCDQPAMQARLEWLRRLAAERLGRDAEQPWLAPDVPAFEREFEVVPRSAGTLHRIGLARLADLKDDVEHGRFSPRAELDGSEGEQALQLWVAGRLDAASRGRYSCDRETETSRGKQSDVQLSAPGVPPVQMELKWAQEWSYAELLEDALERQLVGQYLHDAGLRHGILVLANGRKSTGGVRRDWRPASGPALTFAELVENLGSIAREMLERDARLDGLDVVGIDFT